jgi:ABC-type nitrate/sulfonate/bicarbonate transport system ATPase subunit
MTGRPGTVTARIHIALPRPRQLDIQSTTAFQEYAAAVRAAIEAD